MNFSKTVKSFYVIKNRQDEIIKLASGKFCWEKIGSANNALAQHLQKSVLYTSRDKVSDERIQEIINKGWIVRVYNPMEFYFILDGVTHKVNSIKEIRETFIKAGFIRIEEIN